MSSQKKRQISDLTKVQ